MAQPTLLTGKDSAQKNETSAKAAQVLVKIREIQKKLIVKSSAEAEPVSHSMQYLNHFSLDLARLLHTVLKKADVSAESLKTLMSSIEP